MAEKKTAAQKAQEALDVATRKRDRTKSKVDSLKDDLEQQEGLLKIQQAEVEFLEKHPSLPKTSQEAAAEDAAAGVTAEDLNDPMAFDN